MLLGPVAGMALKIFDINGPTLLEDEPDTGTFDYATINAPVFFCNTVEHYLFIKDLFIEAGQYFAQGRQGQHRFFREWVTGKGTLDEDQWAWEELLAFVSLAQIRPVNLLLSNYYTMGAVRHGDYVAKIRIAPVPEFASRVARHTLDLASAPEVFRPALVAELRERPFEFDIQVQLCADIDRMPVEDVTVEWPEQLSPFVTGSYSASVSVFTATALANGHGSHAQQAAGSSLVTGSKRRPAVTVLAAGESQARPRTGQGPA